MCTIAAVILVTIIAYAYANRRPRVSTLVWRQSEQLHRQRIARENGPIRSAVDPWSVTDGEQRR